jgi:putative radical SAM enzyme (TIGR03279 family)
MVEIIDIIKGSIADELGIQAGDKIISINDNEITDRLDYRYYTSGEFVEILIRRNDTDYLFEIEKDFDEPLGITVEDMRLQSCGNKCIFCFVNQNPKGLRKPLYFKDEDYRYSFLYGHYVTMTTMTDSDLHRIVKQRLSPLYISVHATDLKIRKKLLGIKKDDHLLRKIKYLTDNGIVLHAQIVLCPTINDGKVFEQTVNDLKSFYPYLKSIAVVPVGLTQFRKNLFPLRLHTVEELQEMIQKSNRMREVLKEELGSNFIYISDEFFIKARQPLPDASYYESFEQIENGVGEFRKMIDDFAENEDLLPAELQKEIHITWVTARLSGEYFEKFIINRLRKIKNLSIDLIVVENDFYGHSIQVSGLLVAGDIYNQLKNAVLGDILFLPPRVINEDGFFLDNWTLQELEKRLNIPCHIFTEDFYEIEKVIDNSLNKINSI